MFVYLTEEGERIRVNMDKVWYYQKSPKGEGSRVWMSETDSIIVKETPAQIDAVTAPFALFGESAKARNNANQ